MKVFVATLRRLSFTLQTAKQAENFTYECDMIGLVFCERKFDSWGWEDMSKRRQENMVESGLRQWQWGTERSLPDWRQI